MVARLAVVGSLLLVALSLVAAGCASSDGDAGGAEAAAPPPASCPEEWEAGWQKLADRVGAAVYCPSWLPAPLTGELGGQWHTTNSVKRDRSYLMGFIWFERGSGEVHVNFRGYPGRTAVPECDGRPCFSDPTESKRVGDLDVQVYAVNRGADTWHLLYGWERDGSLYTVSQHVVPDLGLTYAKVAANLDRIVKGLEVLEPARA